MAIWHMRIACCIPKATITHSEYVTLVALPLKQRSQVTHLDIMLHVHCLSCYNAFLTSEGLTVQETYCYKFFVTLQKCVGLGGIQEFLRFSRPQHMRVHEAPCGVAGIMWRERERERERNTRTRKVSHLQQRGTCNNARYTEKNKRTGSYCFVSSHKQQFKHYSPSIMLFL